MLYFFPEATMRSKFTRSQIALGILIVLIGLIVIGKFVNFSP